MNQCPDCGGTLKHYWSSPSTCSKCGRTVTARERAAHAANARPTEGTYELTPKEAEELCRRIEATLRPSPPSPPETSYDRIARRAEEIKRAAIKRERERKNTWRYHHPRPKPLLTK